LPFEVRDEEARADEQLDKRWLQFVADSGNQKRAGTTRALRAVNRELVTSEPGGG